MPQDLKIRNHKGIIFGFLNINSIKNKFEPLKCLISNNIVILAIAETKVDNSFKITQFYLESFKPPFSCNRNRNGGGILVYVRGRST